MKDYTLREGIWEAIFGDDEEPNPSLRESSMNNSDNLPPDNSDAPRSERILEAFREWRETAKDMRRWIVFVKEENGERRVAVRDISPSKTQRYFKEGRRRIGRRLKKKLDNEASSGVHLVLEFDANRFTVDEAWKRVNAEVSRFMEALNKARRRKFKTLRRLGYVRVLEAHKSGYPHVHIWFPKLNWLWGRKKLEKLWGNGFVFVKKCTASVAGYVLKYLGKLKGWSDIALAMLWYFRLRLYSVSRWYYLKREERLGWRKWGVYLTPWDVGGQLLGLGVKHADVLWFEYVAGQGVGDWFEFEPA